jgi:putative FmdB family regulatory protein
MPVYEYFCDDCRGVFELLRPVRESSNPQPCPVCDADSKRLMPTEFAAYVVREGLPRRIPDTGKYWTSEGLSDKPETGDSAEDMGYEYPWKRSGTVNSEDHDREEMRQAYLMAQDEYVRDTGAIPEVDVMIMQEGETYRQKLANTEAIKKKLKSPLNKDVTPRTRTGDPSVPSTLAAKKRASSRRKSGGDSS